MMCHITFTGKLRNLFCHRLAVSSCKSRRNTFSTGLSISLATGLFFLLLLPSRTFGQEYGLPHIKNYSYKEYKGAHQNWDVVQDSNEVMYFGNGNGVLIYDGSTWQTVNTTNNTTVRSLSKDAKNTVYVGAKNEMGIIKKDKHGDYYYESLKPYIDPTYQNFTDVWKNHTNTYGTYFFTPGLIYQWNGEKFNYWPINENSFTVQEGASIYYIDKIKGLVEIRDTTFTPIRNGKELSDKKLVFIERMETGRRLVGLNTGLMIWNDQDFLPFKVARQDQLKSHKPYCGKILKNGIIAIGTLYGGLYLYNPDGSLRNIINQKSGLLSNTCNYLYEDEQGGLWVMSNAGFSRLEINTPLRVFNELTHLSGSLRDIIRYKDTLMAATSEGVYFYDKGEKHFIKTEKIEGQGWKFHKFRQDLLVLHGYGIYQWNSGSPELIVSAKSNRAAYATRNWGDDKIIIGYSNGLGMLKKTGTKWEYYEWTDQFSSQIISIALIDDNTLWAGTSYSGVLKIELNDTTLTNVTEYNTAHGLPHGEIKISSYDDQFYFLTEKGLYTFNDSSGYFETDSIYNGFLTEKSISHMRIDPLGNAWFLITENFDSYLFFSPHDRDTIFPFTPFNRISTSNILAFNIDHESLWMGTSDALLKLDYTKDWAPPKYKTLIQKVILNSDSIVNPIHFSEKELDYSNNFIQFQFTSTNYDASSHNQYQYYLSGFDQEWSELSPKNDKKYTHLPEGEYTFKVRARNIFGMLGEEAHVQFTILPPWYRTYWAYFSYAAIFIAILLLYSRWRSRAIKRQNIRLEAIIHERTRKIEDQNIRLQEQADQLKELDEVKSRLFANISHEFRTPLTLILNPIQKYLKSDSKALAKTEATLIYRSANRLLRLINQLLDLSKIDSKEMKIHLSYGDIFKFGNIIASSFTSLSEEKHIEYIVNIPKDSCIGYYDADKLEKILYNLISNAFKFTPENGLVIVSLDCIEELEDQRSSANKPEGRWVIIQIVDTGKGIPKKVLKDIYNRFYQVDDSYTKANEGTGIGLALTKELIEMQKGTIKVEGEFGKGSTFKVMLPLDMDFFVKHNIEYNIIPEPIQTEENYEALTVNIANPDKCISEDYLLGNKRVILIAEDNQAVREYIRENIGSDYHFVEAENGVKALQKSIEIIPDLIITDLMMPEMDGLKLCEELKNNIKTSHIPVIVVTARAGIDDKLKGLKTGADSYLTKPYNVEELQIRIQSLLKQRDTLKRKYTANLASYQQDLDIGDRDKEFLQKTIKLMEEHLSDATLTVERFQSMLGMSRTQLHRKFKAITDQSPSEFIRTIRLKRAAAMILKSDRNVSEVAYEVGFSDPSYFTKCFRKMYGMAPKEYLLQHS